MSFLSFEFLWLFPLVFGLYYLVGLQAGRRATVGRTGNLLLLLLSYLLYARWSAWFWAVLLWVTLVTYVAGLVAGQRVERGQPVRGLLWGSVGLALCPLLTFKYAPFLVAVAQRFLFGPMGLAPLTVGGWVIPVGISFFTFQAVGYVVDVARGRIAAERDVWHYMLFVSFFPQVLAGPISRAADLLPQIRRERPFCRAQATLGLRCCLWGLFLKVVLADRLGLYVDTVYDTWAVQSSLTCLVASGLYSLQIYGDFAGYSLMAVGVGRLLGFELVNNFERPYLASSVTAFWRRWHISLTRWLTTYVYIELGGNRCSRVRQAFNVMVTFLVSGLWHGAGWTFVVWGGLHGAVLVAERQCRWPQRVAAGWRRVAGVGLTFAVVTLAWVFFRMPTLDEACGLLVRMASWQGTSLFAPPPVAVLALVLVAVCDVVAEWWPQLSLFAHPNVVVRWASYLAVVVLVMLLGVFDAGQFIYLQF